MFFKKINMKLSNVKKFFLLILGCLLFGIILASCGRPGYYGGGGHHYLSEATDNNKIKNHIEQN